MQNNIAIYGGFNGDETTLNQRNWKTNVTILSGDIDQNDNPSIAVYNLFTHSTRSNNSLHVVNNDFLPLTNLTNSAVLDGFTVTGGNSDDIRGGGAMYNRFASPYIVNCIFTGNSARDGGGLYNNASSPKMINCILSHNQSNVMGGAIYNSGLNGSSFPEFINCDIVYNWAGPTQNIPWYSGGAIQNSNSTGVLTNCIVWGNNTRFNGGTTTV